jgi:hypothetical protein
MVVDGHGHFTGNMDWGTKEFLNLKERMERLHLTRQGYVKFSNVMSPAVSTIMSIESILSGIYAAKTHKMHWREWPSWDRFEHPTLSGFLKERGFEVNGFSYLLNSENWLPSINCYRPGLYKDYPSLKRDTHSHEAVLAAMRHYFANDYKKGTHKHVFVVHSIFLFDIWDEIMRLFTDNGFSSDNTVFALTSDHYFPYGFGRQWLLGERDGSSIYHHTDLTEHNTRVFLYVKYPGCPGGEIHTPVAGYDIAPTLLDLLGFLPDWKMKLDGVSLVPLMNGTGLPERFLRSDNVYPYQIGEKQGRITALKKENLKYVYRPDGPASYIAYRLTEGWSTVLEREELYDVNQDPFERNNLIREKNLQNTVDSFREGFLSTQDEIIRFHVDSLRNVFRKEGLKGKLFGGRETGQMLFFQSCPDVVFRTLIGVLSQEMPDWDIDVVVRKGGDRELPDVKSVRNRFVYPDAGPFNPRIFHEAIGHQLPANYDCVLNTSNVPMGDYLSVYDESEFPVGDFHGSTEIIRKLIADNKGSLCLDMSFQLIGSSRGSNATKVWNVDTVKATARGFASAMVKFLKPRVRKWMLRFAVGQSRMQKVLRERLIRPEDSP